jgi:hypothetical protein
MEALCLYPLQQDSGLLLRHAKLPPHGGVGRIASHSTPLHPLTECFKQIQQALGQPVRSNSEHDFDATFLVPAVGDALILLRGARDSRLSRDFGKGLTIAGESANGRFELHCPEYYIHAVSSHEDELSWAIATPVNEAVSIHYGEPRPVAKVHALINNFDFRFGNVLPAEDEIIRQKVLRVEVGRRVVEFSWRRDHDELRLLVDTGILRSTALVAFTFDVWADASEEELTTFTYDIASLCGIVARQHTGVPVLSFLDENGHVVKRVVGNPIESPFRSQYALRLLHSDNGLPKLFRECFDEHVKMRRSKLWGRLPFICAAIEDPPYLEQKFATLMGAVEMLIRSTLVEGNHCTPEEGKALTLPALIGAARRMLGWEIPNHYTAHERHRHLRNAVAHGGDLPCEIESVRHNFDKWYLFLMRRILIRLGYTSDVASPESGFASSSSVDNFAEEHNTFGD